MRERDVGMKRHSESEHIMWSFLQHRASSEIPAEMAQAAEPPQPLPTVRYCRNNRSKARGFNNAAFESYQSIKCHVNIIKNVTRGFRYHQRVSSLPAHHPCPPPSHTKQKECLLNTHLGGGLLGSRLLLGISISHRVSLLLNYYAQIMRRDEKMKSFSWVRGDAFKIGHLTSRLR